MEGGENITKRGPCTEHGLTDFRKLRDGYVCAECYRLTRWSDDAWRHQESALLARFENVELKDS